MKKVAAIAGASVLAIAAISTGVYVATDSSSTTAITSAALGAPPLGVVEVGLPNLAHLHLATLRFDP